MARVKWFNFGGDDKQRVGLLFECPACGYSHPFYVATPKTPSGEPWPTRDGKPWPIWTFNGDEERPTFSPSLLVHGAPEANPPTPRCHSFVRDGRIEFCTDSTHAMAGRTVDLPEIE